MNDQETLTYFTELTLFKNNPAREIIVFPPTMASTQRRIIHTLAHHMGLNHRSVGEGASRQLHVLKEPIASTTGATSHASTVHQNNRSLNRAATIDFTESRQLNSYSSGTLNRQGRVTLEVPDSPDAPVNELRGVKSFADLRNSRQTPSPAPSMTGFPMLNGSHSSAVALYGDYSTANTFAASTTSMPTPTTPGGTDAGMLLGGIGGLTLSDSYPASQGRPRETPGAIGRERPGLNGPNRSQPDRQPLGPSTGERNEFGGGWQRARQNGHTQRDSGMSLAQPTRI
jgi:hypothetical protein